MPKERKLAIKMWTDIRNMLSASDGLKWKHSCWFCQYIPYCSKCPLSDCDSFSDYDDVVNDRLDKDVRVAACNVIIKALGGSVNGVV